MLHQHLNRNCPHCGGYLVVLTEEDPMSFNFESKTKIDNEIDNFILREYM